MRHVSGGEAYESIPSKNLLALLCEAHLNDAQFPASYAPSDLGAHGACYDLVSEADTDDPHAPSLEEAPRILYQPQDPLVALEAVVFRAADEHGVERLGVRVGRLVLVHDVVTRELELRFYGLGGHGSAEQVCEDGAVAATIVLCLDRGHGCITFEDREADRWGDLGAHLFSRNMQVVLTTGRVRCGSVYK